MVDNAMGWDIMAKREKGGAMVKIYNKQSFVLGLIQGLISLGVIVLCLLKGDATQWVGIYVVILFYAVMLVSKSFMKASSYPEIKRETDGRERNVLLQSMSKTLDIVEAVGSMVVVVTFIVYVVTKQRCWLMVCVVLSAYGALADVIRLATYRYYKKHT